MGSFTLKIHITRELCKEDWNRTSPCIALHFAEEEPYRCYLWTYWWPDNWKYWQNRRRPVVVVRHQKTPPHFDIPAAWKPVSTKQKEGKKAFGLQNFHKNTKKGEKSFPAQSDQYRPQNSMLLKVLWGVLLKRHDNGERFCSKHERWKNYLI